MKNKLFIVCPFSQMETYLQKKYGNDVYFISAPAAIAQWNQKEYTEAISDFIKRESIREIFLVNDTDCRFIESIINKQKLYGLYSEKILESIYIECFFSHFKNASPLEKKMKLAELNIHYQIRELMKFNALRHYIPKEDVQLKGLITSKKENLYQEITIN